MTPDDLAREIARCEQEIAEMEQQEPTRPAFLVCLGIEDWRAELRILERSVRPLAIDLYCGLGGWAEGFLAEGYDVIGFDIERRPYPGQLVLQDVLTLHGRQFKDAAVIVGSSPCQEFSYRAMPWKRAKALPPPELGMRLFEAQFRIQREASEAAGRSIPLVVENVCGAQRWVGRARWHYGSYYLWGDVPALMPFHRSAFKLPEGFERNHPRAFGWKLPNTSSHSQERRNVSAKIAKIPFDLAQHIARCFKPEPRKQAHHDETHKRQTSRSA